jgi:3-oxoadipate enol-lactonase
MPTVSANGIKIYYELHGPEEGDVLVLSNGILMSTASWAYQIADLARDYRLLLYDCRGMWQSAHPAGPYTMALHADDLAALLEALGVEAAHIGGASYGAEVSMAFALKYPTRTRSLIVTSAVSQVDPVLAGIAGSWIAAAEASDAEMFYRAVYPVTFSDGWIATNGGTLAAARQRYEAIDYDAMLRLLQCFLALDLTADLPRIQAPTLVAVGEEDILKPRRYAEIIARAIPNSELVVIPRAGHALIWEQPGIINTLILGFLAKHASRTQTGSG